MTMKMLPQPGQASYREFGSGIRKWCFPHQAFIMSSFVPLLLSGTFHRFTYQYHSHRVHRILARLYRSFHTQLRICTVCTKTACKILFLYFQLEQWTLKLLSQHLCQAFIQLLSGQVQVQDIVSLSCPEGYESCQYYKFIHEHHLIR